MININNLSIGYREKGFSGAKDLCVDSITLSLEKGKIISLFGPNGCGKTTILQFLTGLGSKLMYASQKQEDISSRLKFGYIMQNARRSLFNWMSTLDNISLPLVLLGKKWSIARERILETIGPIGEWLIWDEPVEELSEGQKQLIVVARELCREPEVLLIDEGFVSLDYNVQLQLMILLRKWCQNNNNCILSISHDAEEAAFFSDEVLILSEKPACIKGNVYSSGPKIRSQDLISDTWLNSDKIKIEHLFLEGTE